MFQTFNLTIVLLFTAGVAQAQTNDQAAQPPAQPAQTPKGGHRMGFDAMDANHDGVLTRDEWLAAGRRERGFAFMDGNGDGRVTREELAAGIQKVRERRAGAVREPGSPSTTPPQTPQS